MDRNKDQESNLSTLTLSVEETARHLGVCTRVVYELTRRADFPTIKIGRRTRISREGLRAWVLAQAQSGMEAVV